MLHLLQVVGITVGQHIHPHTSTQIHAPSPLDIPLPTRPAFVPQVAGIIVGARNTAHVADHEKIFAFSLDDGACCVCCACCA